MMRLFPLIIAVLAVNVMSGCSEPPTPEETPATPAAFNVEGLPTVEISVPGMMCEQSCVPTVRDSLARQQGVRDVKVDLETKTATVAVREDMFDADAAVADLLDLGFEDTQVAGDEPDGDGESANAVPASDDEVGDAETPADEAEPASTSPAN